MLEERVDDRPFLRLIGKWLKAGVLEEDGEVLMPEAGTPQGGSVSPVLANIYLHYVLDLWFEKVVKRHCQGEVLMILCACFSMGGRPSCFSVYCLKDWPGLV